MTRRAVARTVRTAAPEERAEFERAWAKANAALNPSPAALSFRELRWAMKAVRAFEANGRSFVTEREQYIALYALRADHLKRVLPTEQCERLRLASKAIWMATTSKAARRLARSTEEN